MANLALIDKSQEGSQFLGKMPETPEEQITVLNAIINTENKVADLINQNINLANVFIKMIEVQSTQEGHEGELVLLPRIVLFDDAGNTYGCGSNGMYNALSNLFGVFGTPQEWINPITICIRQRTTKKGNTLTFDVINANGNVACM